MKTVLLVEDDKFLIKVYKMKMESKGVRTICLSDGVDVLSVSKKEKPGAIILDLIMPNRDGFEVLKDLKSDPDTKNIPVIVLSALESSEDVKRVMSLGADKYVAKTSVSLSYVVELVSGYIN